MNKKLMLRGRLVKATTKAVDKVGKMMSHRHWLLGLGERSL